MSRSFSPEFQQFLDLAVATYPRLSADEERSLIRSIQTGSKDLTNHLTTTRAKADLDRMVGSNVLLVAKFALLNKDIYTNPEDKFQAGVFGLYHAIGRFDLRRPVKFSTYATPWIRVFIDRQVKDTNRTIRIPRDIQVLAERTDRQRWDQAQFTGEVISDSQWADQIGMEPEELSSLNQTRIPVFGLGIPQLRQDTGEEFELVDTNPDLGVDVEREVTMNGLLTKEVADILESTPLTEVERFALTKRFGLEDGQELTYPEVAELLKERLPEARQRSRNGKRKPELNPRDAGHIIKSAILKIRENPEAIARLSAYLED